MQYLIKLIPLLLTISSLHPSTASAIPVNQAVQKRTYLSNATEAVNALQKNWYSSSNGLWENLWWNSGSILSTVSLLAAMDSSVRSSVESAISNTFKAAPGKDGTDATGFISPAPVKPSAGSGFINGWYDDEGWWAMGWINAYDLTGNADYLAAAEAIFDDMVGGWTTPCGGGIWWDKAHSYVAAISNELFLSVAAHLANRVPSKKSAYLGWAVQEWRWFASVGLINSANNINDGLASCKNNNGAVWSYNQGVILGGLVELSKASGNSSILTEATTIALAGISKLSNSNGILVDPTSANPDTTAAQFKGIFARNLGKLHGAAPNSRFAAFLQKNAESIWKQDRDASTSQLGPDWQGPYVSASAASHSAALDCLVAAASI